MNRRELIGWISGFTASAALAPLSATDRLGIAETLHARPARITGALSERQAAMVTLLADTILPATETPGAVDVGVPQFIDHLVGSWYSDQERADLQAGIAALDQRMRGRGGQGFLEASPADRVALLTELDGKIGKPGSAEHTFDRIKSLTIYGYLTSKPVQRDLLKSVIIPGRFDGCIPAPGQ